jgi:Fe-Mn family superoxide dismutase
MAHEPKNYERLFSELRGALSEPQLRAHFALYQGYVKKLNEIEHKLASVDRDLANYSFGDYSELKRREPVAYNGTVLHELYFSNLGSTGEKIPPGFHKAATSAFGSFDSWAKDVAACVASAHGWCLTVYDFNFGVIRNVLVSSEHHVGLLPNSAVLVAIDGWEHAYFLDYATKKADYVEKVLQHLKWSAVEQRLTWTPLGANHKPR